MNCGGGVGGFMASRDEERYVREYNGFLISITETAEARAVRLRPRQRAPDLLRHARERQGLDRQLGLSVGHRQCGLHVAAGAAGLPRDRRADPQRSRTMRRGGWRRFRASRSAIPAASSRNSWSISPAPARPSPRSTRSCASTASSAARTCHARGHEAMRALLRDRSAHCRRHRPAGRGDRAGGGIMSDKRRCICGNIMRRSGTSRWSCRWAIPAGAARCSRSPNAAVVDKVGAASSLIPEGHAREPARPRCRKCPSPRCSATICICARRRWA